VLGDSSNCISIVYFNCQGIVYPNLMSLFVFVWPINHLLSVSQKHDFALTISILNYIFLTILLLDMTGIDMEEE